MAHPRSLLPPVLYEDAALIAFDKPAGLLVAPDRWDRARANLMGMIHQHLSRDVFNAHRLDLATTGVLLCAKTPPVLRALAEAFARGRVHKVYLALAASAPGEPAGVVRAALAADPRRPGRMRVAAVTGAKSAETSWTVVERWRSGHALLRAEPRTGRTHQVRVHLALAGAPIVADDLYGSARGLYLSDLKRRYKPGPGEERPLLARLGLHAAQLELAHPVDGTPLRIESPLPADLALALKMLRKWSQAA